MKQKSGYALVMWLVFRRIFFRSVPVGLVPVVLLGSVLMGVVPMVPVGSVPVGMVPVVPVWSVPMGEVPGVSVGCVPRWTGSLVTMRRWTRRVVRRVSQECRRRMWP